jgi:hypothetical protein
MTTGAVIFAYNNDQIDYLALARWSASNINRHLNIPTAIVTNQKFTAQAHERCILAQTTGNNRRYFSDYDTNVEWHNTNRMDAYNLSPWDRTMVIDADYVVASSQLKVMLDSNLEFVCHRQAYDITGLSNFADLNVFGLNNMPMSWATVMIFDRCPQAKLIFDMMAMIRDNWDYYKQLYHDTSPSYRNDHALSIALNTVNGHTLDYTAMPWNLASLTPGHKLECTGQDQYCVNYVTPQGRQQYIEITDQDFHAMGKQQLGEIVASYS